MGRVKFKCERCNKEFNWLLNGVADDGLKMLFCSRACQIQYKRDLAGMKPPEGIAELHKAFTDGVLVTREWYETQQQQIKQLQAEVESLKCCGNCVHLRVIVNENKCFEGLPWDEGRFSKKAKPVDCDFKCSNWQKAGD